jgi:hypothetical protein
MVRRFLVDTGRTDIEILGGLPTKDSNVKLDLIGSVTDEIGHNIIVAFRGNLAQ